MHRRKWLWAVLMAVVFVGSLSVARAEDPPVEPSDPPRTGEPKWDGDQPRSGGGWIKGSGTWTEEDGWKVTGVTGYVIGPDGKKIPVEVTWDPKTKTWSFDKSGLPEGDYTIVIEFTYEKDGKKVTKKLEGKVTVRPR